MMRYRITAATLAVVFAAMGLTIVTPSRGEAIVQQDGNDTRGKFDIRSVTTSVKADDISFMFKTFEKWKANATIGRSYFLIAFDDDGDRKADTCAFMYYHGRLLGQLTNCRRTSYTSIKVAHPSGTTAKMTIENGATESHYWFAGSVWTQGRACSDGCADAAPNRKWLFNDFEPPTTKWVTPSPSSRSSTAFSSTNVVPLEFEATDDSGSIESWTFRSLVGIDTYEDVATGPGDDLTPAVALEEGKYYELRPFATDAGGNEGAGFSFLKFAVPYDDQNALVEFSSGWTHVDDPGSFQGSYSTSSTPGATATITFTAPHDMNSMGLVFGPAEGTASVSVGGPGQQMTETLATQKLQAGPIFNFAAPGEYTMTVTIVNGSFVLDGFLVART